MKTIIGIVLLLAISLQGQSTDTYIELLRSNIQLEKKAIIAESLNLSNELSEKFWPIYNEYEIELVKISNNRVSVIKDYAENYEALSDTKAKELIETAFTNRENLYKLDKKYYSKIEEAIGGRYAGKFIQLISRINTIIDIQVSAQLPLFPVPSDSIYTK